jgi:hypothetical protein
VGHAVAERRELPEELRRDDALARARATYNDDCRLTVRPLGLLNAALDEVEGEALVVEELE